MVLIGLDVGTTTLSSVAFDTDQGVPVTSKTLPNAASLPPGAPWQRQQDPEVILHLCEELLQGYGKQYPVGGVGLTGQMHGVLYLDRQGTALSPLYTWEDERGNLSHREGVSHCEFLQRETGYPMATGFGLTTHFYNLENDLVPKNAVTLCTIGDYLAMRLTRQKRPLMHKSNAAGIGLFDLSAGAFSATALQKAGIDPAFLPGISPSEQVVGQTAEGWPVAIAIGDNQASFLGSVGQGSNLLVNVGTGSQVSLCSAHLPQNANYECRPYLDGQYLLLGSVLCGGAAFQLLRDFFLEVTQTLGTPKEVNFYALMEQEAEKAAQCGDPLLVDTRFRGSRQQPGIRGSIQNIGPGNFTLGQLTLGVLQGMCDELYGYYDKMPGELKEEPVVVGSGNAVRKTKLLQHLLESTFQKQLRIPRFEEEAAFGASLLAARLLLPGCSWAQVRRYVRYQ
ncbi:hypothetical protein LJC49_05635 [Ruminococcaceae bacterium OttesenSCG-928-I18]|nr:hypothetical protein [Ruminococcaceae bacterium OttesenSCG-928-I18]